MRLVNAGVFFQNTTDSPTENTDASFAGGAKIFRCGSNITNYYTVNYPDGRSYSFYPIVRLTRTSNLVLEPWCEIANDTTITYTFKFDTVGSLPSLALRNGTTLMVAYADAPPVLLSVRALPDHVWSSGHRVFIVPTKLLAPGLKRAGDDPAKRYLALMKVIGESPASMTVSER